MTTIDEYINGGWLQNYESGRPPGVKDDNVHDQIAAESHCKHCGRYGLLCLEYHQGYEWLTLMICPECKTVESI
jgi:hypothetical protein